MTKGYVVLAQNSKDDDYARMAYALALSIQNSQTEVKNVTLVTDIKKLPKKYKVVFDKIVDIPWLDNAAKSKWKIENKWKYIHASPYDETVILDADMLFPGGIYYLKKMCG